MSLIRSSIAQSAQSRFDFWIRKRFATLNTELEELYASGTEGSSASHKLCQTLLQEGKTLLREVEREGSWPDAFDEKFALLGNVGLYMAACSRHGLNEAVDDQSPLTEASRLAERLGRDLDVAPRFLAAHLSLLNPAQDGRPKLFTFLKAERVFIDYNTRGMVAFQVTSQLLKAVLGVGISGRWAATLLDRAKESLQAALRANKSLMEELEVEPFFQGVRPYYKPHQVGARVYRGANAGDFAAINEVDLLLGLCSARDPFYRAVLDEKRNYLIPEDRSALDRTRQRSNLLDEFLAVAQHFETVSKPEWWDDHLVRFLEVCKLHGTVAALHHNGLVDRFIARPASRLPEQKLNDLTASGPPLHEVIKLLERLKDLRRAAPRQEIQSRHQDIEFLKSTLH